MTVTVAPVRGVVFLFLTWSCEMNSLVLALCLGGPPAPCPECLAAGFAVATPPPAATVVVPAPAPVPAPKVSSSVTVESRVKVRTRVRERVLVGTPVRGVFRGTAGVVRRAVGAPVRVVVRVFGGC